MKYLASFTVVALLGFAATDFTYEKDGKVVITQTIYKNDFIKYQGEHDIVKLVVPLNALNVNETESDMSESFDFGINIILFFVEADVQPDGSLIDQGLYVLKNGKATKILEYGRDADASADDSKLVFFGAKDGLYVYNPYTNSAEKYGPITDSIIGIAKEKKGDVIYILTEDRTLYKITNNGENKEKIEDVVNAKKFIIDHGNNIYFYSDDKQAYARSINGVTKIEGLPENPSSISLVKPPYFLDDCLCVPFVVDNQVYIIYANGTSELSPFEFKAKVKPTAYAPDGLLIQYYAHDKKIYEYNVLAMILGFSSEDIAKYLSEKETEIKRLASQPKRTLA